jgi:excisionase family DNA binding protein
VPDELLSVFQAADLARTHPEVIRRWVRKGELRAIRASKHAPIRIKRGDLEALLKSNDASLPPGHRGPIEAAIRALEEGGNAALAKEVYWLREDADRWREERNQAKRTLEALQEPPRTRLVPSLAEVLDTEDPDEARIIVQRLQEQVRRWEEVGALLGAHTPANAADVIRRVLQVKSGVWRDEPDTGG